MATPLQDFEFRPFEPEPALRKYIRRTFYARGRIPYSTEKILPTGYIVAIFNLGAPHRLGKSPHDGDQRTYRHWVEGLQTTPNYHSPTDGTHVLGLQFTPPGFHALFGHNMANLVDTILPAEKVFTAGFLAAMQRHLTPAVAAESHQVIHTLLSNITSAPLPDWLWRSYSAIEDSRGAVSLDSMYAASGRSSRYVTGKFSQAVGVSPKVLCRIHRLLALLDAVDPQQDVNWTALAHDYGFYDQPHFNREFRKLSGLFPSEYLAQRRRNYPAVNQGEHVVFAPLD